MLGSGLKKREVANTVQGLMSWPTLQDYNDAIQNPQLAFSDPDLRTGQPELNQLGLPRPIAGNFACVYKIQIGGQRWAARCFSSEVSDQHRRYEAISSFLKKASLRYTVQFTFLPGGIKVLGKNYPLLKMEWVQGESLAAFVGKSIGYPDTLLSLAKVWSSTMGDLKAGQHSAWRFATWECSCRGRSTLPD